MAKHRGSAYSRQAAFHVERDLLCDVIDIEDSDAASKTAYYLCRKSALIGEFVISQEAREEILCAAESSFELLCSIKRERMSRVDQQILAVACVLLLQSNTDSADDSALQDSAETWQPIMDGLHFHRISQKTGCGLQTARKRLCELLEDPENIRFFAEGGKRYYNTLRLHAISPVWSIKNLYDILYAFYHKNLECVYEIGSSVASMFTSGIRNRWDAGDAEEDQNLGASQLASSLRELFILRPKYMSAVCDALLEKIDRLVQGDQSLLDARNRWDVLLLEWYHGKTEFERQQMRTDRKAAVKRKVVDRKEDIKPQFVYEDGNICLQIPGIRLPEIQERPVVRLYQNDQLICEQQLSVYGNKVLMSTRSKMIPLDDLEKINWNKPFCFSVDIESGTQKIYNSGGTLFRDYLCFAPAGNEVRLSRCSQILRLILRQTAKLEIDDPMEEWTEDTAPYRSIRLWPESVTSIKLNGKELLAEENESRGRIWAYLTPEPITGVRAKVDKAAVAVYARHPTLQVHLPGSTDAKNYLISIDEQTRPLYCYDWINGRLQIALPQDGKKHRIQLKDFETGHIVFDRSYAVLPDFSFSFDRQYYLDVDCEGDLLVHIGRKELRIPFHLTAGEDLVTWEIGSVSLETDAPRIRAEIDEKNAFLLPEYVWYGALEHALLKVKTPENVTCSVWFGRKLMVRNHTGHYEIGTEIQRRNLADSSAVLGLVIRSEESQQKLLTEVCYTERFISNPVHQEGRRIIWDPISAGYLGARDTAVFRLEIENSLQTEPFRYTQYMKRSVVEKEFPGKEGSYGYTLWLTERKKRFVKLPDLKLLEGVLHIQDPLESRFKDNHIALTQVCYCNPVSNEDETAPMRGNGALIDQIIYEGMVEVNGVMTPEYSGYLFFRTKAGWEAFSDRDLKRYEKVNPVYFVFDEDGYISVRHENGETLMINIKPFKVYRNGAAQIFSRKDELEKDEQSLYLAFADRFRYTIGNN